MCGDVCVYLCVSVYVYVSALQVSFSLFPFFNLWKNTPSCPTPGLAVPTRGFSSSNRIFLPAQLCSLPISQPLLANFFVSILIISFPGPWQQRDPLQEGWHLERVLPPVQGDAGAVCSAHPAQQPPEAAVCWWLWHRWVSIPNTWPHMGAGSRRPGNGREGGKSLQSFNSPSVNLFARVRTCYRRLFREMLLGNVKL